MRTNIDIDDELMAAAMAAGGFKTKKAAVEEGLRLLCRRAAYRDLLALRGKLHWEDPLAEGAWPAAVREPVETHSVSPRTPVRAEGKTAVRKKSGRDG